MSRKRNKNNHGVIVTGCGKSITCSGCGKYAEKQAKSEEKEVEFPEISTDLFFSEGNLMEQMTWGLLISNCIAKIAELREKYEDDVQLVILLDTEESEKVMTAKECWEFLDNETGDYTMYSDVEAIYDEQIMIAYNPEDVVTFGGKRYLMGYAVIFEMDENGNECSIDEDTLLTYADFVIEKSTFISVDGEKYMALCLD